jgi:hypothetical protein
VGTLADCSIWFNVSPGRASHAVPHRSPGDGAESTEMGVTYWEFMHWLVEHDYLDEAVVELHSLRWSESAIMCWIRGVVERYA